MYIYICIFIDIYICIYICICICVYIYVYIYVCIYMYVYIYIRVCVYVYACIYMCVYIYMCIYIYMCVYIYVYIYVYICVYIFICVYICVYIYIYIYIKAMFLFCTPAKLSIVYLHPVLKSRHLFFIFDSVHILKCIRNNWFGQKDASKCIFPKFCFNGNHELNNVQSASFCTLQKLHALESQSLLKHCSKMTAKALSPSNLERQNVNFVLQIFNEYTIQGLLTLGKEKCLPNFAEVAGFINIFFKRWNIMNVKIPVKGWNLQNKYCNPLKLNEENYAFLTIFCNWLESWDSHFRTYTILYRRIENGVYITWKISN